MSLWMIPYWHHFRNYHLSNMGLKRQIGNYAVNLSPLVPFSPQCSAVKAGEQGSLPHFSQTTVLLTGDFLFRIVSSPDRNAFTLT
jgi:hypothetical protein